MPTTAQVLGLADTTTANVGDIIPEDVYSTLALEAIYHARQMSGVVTAVREDLTAEAGDTVQVPFMGRRTPQTNVAEGDSLVPTATTTGTYPITIEKHGDYDRVTNEVFEDQEAFDEDDFLRNMASGLAELCDTIVYDELETAVPGFTVDLAVAGSYTDLYDKIIDLAAAMRAAGQKPTHVILNAAASARFAKDTDEGIKFDQITVTNGVVTSIAGMEIIESPLANANVATANAVQAILVNQRRAIGEAWGRRPTRIIDRVTDAPSDKTRLIMWMRYGADELDTDAIGHVLNP